MEQNWPTFLAALAAREQPQATLLALQTLFQREVGARLFTVMTFDAATGLSQRVHSSHPVEYPVSGVKPLSRGLWSRTVIDERKTFVANSIEAIAEVFPDHELIRSLGCESVVNLPVVFADAVIGTVNCLDARGYYTPERVAKVESLAPFAAMALMRRAATSRRQGCSTMSSTIRVATDVGGTFTDLVYFETDDATGQQSIRTAKVHTTPPNFEEGVLNVLAKGKVDVSAVAFFAHGTTVVINALTERKGVKTALITTEGFRDVLEIARGNRPDFFNLMYEKPKPFVPRRLRREVAGRMNYRGEETAPLEPRRPPRHSRRFPRRGRRGDRDLPLARLRQSRA